jgi:hypothetical protein
MISAIFRLIFVGLIGTNNGTYDPTYGQIKATETYKILEYTSSNEYPVRFPRTKHFSSRLSLEEKVLLTQSIEKVKLKYQLSINDIFVILAIAKQETQYNRFAIGKDGECGFYQQIPKWAIDIELRKLPYKQACQKLQDSDYSTDLFIRSYKLLAKVYKKNWPCHYNQGNICSLRGKRYTIYHNNILNNTRRYYEYTLAVRQN